LFRKPCSDAVDEVFAPVDAVPLAPLTKLLNDEVRLAVVGLLLAPLDPNCWISVCSEALKLPYPAPLVLLPEVEVLPACVPVAVPLELPPLLPSPSALRAATKECKKLCTDCDDAVLDTALLEALPVVPATALFVAAAAEVAAVAAALLVADVDVMAGMPITCSNDCNKLLNRP
jgi:hypothetical protein